MRALVVEDDPTVAADLEQALRTAGFAVDTTGDGEDAWYRGDVDDYDLVVLDLGLPQLDGMSVLKRWRAANRTFPVLILSARGEWTEKVDGIEAGADDYLGKPFEMGELIARVRALVRRAAGHASPVVKIGRLTLDSRRMSASIDGTPLRLSPLEFRFVDYLAHQPGRAVAAGEIAEHLYGALDVGTTNAIEALVTRLRRKLGANVIETRRGFGYLLEGSEQ
ncbi:MAG: response regulator transcription factor [Steroidobacteraceae bacterium]